MDKLTLKASGPLSGTIPIAGAKNSALKLMAAAILTDQEVVLNNLPNLADTRFMARLLDSLGIETYWPASSNTLRMRSAELTSTIAPYDLVRKMRATFNVLGPLLARVGHATVSVPGGCAIGARPVDLHLKAFEAMGAAIVIEEGYVKAAALRGLHGADITFPFPSVGATEHAMMGAVLARGHTRLQNAACEPEIADIANFLNSLGAKITGAGTSCIEIEGVSSLGGGEYATMGDRIEAGTFMIAVAATGGDVTFAGANLGHLDALASALRDAGVAVEGVEGGVRVSRAGSGLKPVDIDTRPYPGFPTDLQAQFMALMTIADGVSTIRENIFENRFLHAPELNRLGANISIRGSEAIVHGVGRLKGAPVMATDLRASVSLVIAGLVAEGQTTINRVYHLDRGFENLEAKLNACGAQIERSADSD